MAPLLEGEEVSEDVEDYMSDTPLKPKPNYPELRKTFETAIVLTNLPKVRSYEPSILLAEYIMKKYMQIILFETL